MSSRKKFVKGWGRLDLTLNNWKTIKLGDVAKIKYGKDHKKLEEGNVPVYGTGGLMRYVDTALYEKKSVLIPRKGSLGNLYFANQPFWTVDTLFYTEIDETIVMPEFLYYKLKTYDLASMNVGSAVPSLTIAILNPIELDLPPLSEQEEIVRVLSVLDNGIKINKKINHHLEKMAQAIFQSWFIDFEPFNGIHPSDWKIGKLYQIADITMGQSPKGSSYNENGIGSVFYQGRTDFGERFPTQRLFTTEPKRMADTNDILMSVRAPVGDLNIATEKCCIGRGLASIRSNNQFQSFVQYTMFSLNQNLNMFNGEGTVFGSINKKSLANLPVLIPNDDSILQFEKSVTPIDSAIKNNYLEKCRLIELREALLPRLISGEISTL